VDPDQLLPRQSALSPVGKPSRRATHLLSARNGADCSVKLGFTNVHTSARRSIPSPEVYTGRWFRDAEQLRAFKAKAHCSFTARKMKQWAGPSRVIEMPPNMKVSRVIP